METTADPTLTAMVKAGRPKDKLAKRACQVIEAHLPSLVQEAHLCHTLVTVLPDPTLTIKASWRALEAARLTVVDLLLALPGMYFSVMATEVHAGPRPKKRKEAASSPAEGAPQATGAEDEDPMNLNEEEEPSAAPAPSTQLKGLQGQPHLHLLIYYSKTTDPPLDLSHVKRELLRTFPKADVNQVFQRAPAKGKDSVRSSIVKAMTYVLKGIDCPMRERVLQHVLPGNPASPMNPRLIVGEKLVLGSILGTRLRALMRALTLPIEHHLDIGAAEAPAVHERPLAPSRETTSMLLFAQRVKALGLRIKSDLWYRRQENTEHTWIYASTTAQLLQSISDDDNMLDVCVRYASKIPSWFKLAPFEKLPDESSYRYIELRDAVYDLRSGEYEDKASFSLTCFRYYDINVYRSITTSPTHWLALIDYAYKNDPISANKEDFLLKMAGLLRLRKPKERILFIVGASNCGKSTAIKWITCLYPNDAIATVNDSIAPLSGIKGKEILICDEFSTAKMSRTNLLLLTDGTTGLTVRRMGQDAEFITNVLLPQVFTCNIGHEPRYKNDPQPEAVNNRFQFFEWREEIRNPDAGIAAKIEEETPFIVFYLNRLLNKQA